MPSSSLIRIGFLGLCLTFLSLGCGGDGGPTDPGEDPVVASVIVSPAADTLLAFGATVELSASPRDADGEVVPGQTITWTSSNTAVMEVSPTGLATAVGNGPATITATVATVQGSASLLVTQVPTSVTVTPSSGSATSVGATVQYTADARDANDNVIASPNFLWVSSNHGVATVSQSGLATARGAGAADIIAASAGVPGSASIDVTVASAVSASMSHVSVGSASGLPADGLTYALIEVSLRDANGNPVAGETVSLSVTAEPDLPGAILVQPSAVSDANGIVTGSIASSSFGAKRLTATANPGGDDIVILDKPSASFGATHLAWTSSPVTVESGTRWGSATVEYRDADDNTVTTATRPVTIALTTNPTAGTIMGADLTQLPVDGVVTFDEHGIAFPAATYRLTATPAGVHQIAAAGSDAFGVTAIAVVNGTTNLTTIDTCDDCAQSVLFDTFGDFAFYGVVFGSVQVASNGFLAFTTQSITAFTNVAIPTAAAPNGIVAGFWDDFNPSQAGTVRYTVTGATPDRRFVVEYENVAFFPSAGSARFNIILHETTGLIEFVYGIITHPTAGRANGNSATVGIENREGTSGIQVGFNEQVVRSGVRMLFEFDGTEYQRIMLDP